MEVLAAVFLTSMVIGVAVAFYLNLSDASTRARERLRSALHATAILDRIARDIEGTSLLVKPDSVDPLSHPWFFLAESQYGAGGADRIKFITRSQSPRVTAYHVSDLALVAYFLVTDDGIGYRLHRWVSPGLPLDFDPTFPSADDERSLLLADGIGSFSLLFLNEDGEWEAEWDSSLLAHSSEIPQAVEIKLSLLEDASPDLDPEDIAYFTRRVPLPLRPLDLAQIVAGTEEAGGIAAGGGDEDADDESSGKGNRAANCVEANWERCVETVGELTCGQIRDGSLSIDTTGIDLSAWGCP